jgi:hypothetical protein
MPLSAETTRIPKLTIPAADTTSRSLDKAVNRNTSANFHQAAPTLTIPASSNLTTDRDNSLKRKVAVTLSSSSSLTAVNEDSHVKRAKHLESVSSIYRNEYTYDHIEDVVRGCKLSTHRYRLANQVLPASTTRQSVEITIAIDGEYKCLTKGMINGHAEQSKTMIFVDGNYRKIRTRDNREKKRFWLQIFLI